MADGRTWYIPIWMATYRRKYRIFCYICGMKRIYCIFVENCSGKKELAVNRVYADLESAIADLKKVRKLYPEAGIGPVEVTGGD